MVQFAAPAVRRGGFRAFVWMIAGTSPRMAVRTADAEDAGGHISSLRSLIVTDNRAVPLAAARSSREFVRPSDDCTGAAAVRPPDLRFGSGYPRPAVKIRQGAAGRMS